MDYNHYMSLVKEAEKYTNNQLWIADYGYPADCPYNADQLIDVLNIIFEAAHREINKLVKRVGKMTVFAAKYDVPYRTVQHWCAGTKLPTHEIKLIGYTLVNDINEER